MVARFRLEGGRALIDATLNGKGPFPFIIDTGAVVSGVLEETARAVGLKKIREVNLKGDKFPLYAADEVVLGGAVRMPDVALAGLWRLGGGTGLLAAGLMTTFDSESSRLHAFRQFFGLPDFWAWDAEFNSDRFNPNAPIT